MEAWALARFNNIDIGYYLNLSIESPHSQSSSSSMDSAGDIGIDPEVILAQLRALQLHHDASTPPSLTSQQSSSSWPLSGHMDAGILGATFHPQPPQTLQQQSLRGMGVLAAAQEQSNHQKPPQMARRSSSILRTIYVNGLSPFQTEDELTAFFSCCGAVSDCRICSDANLKSTRFGFVEFEDDASALRALSLTGSVLRGSPICVFPSKTAIVPIKNLNMPRSEEERAAVARTVYINNISRGIERDRLHSFFSGLCGAITKLRLLGDEHHETKIAFIEFSTLEGATMALRCSGVILGGLALRISPSKTPVRPGKGVVKSGQQMKLQQVPQEVPQQFAMPGNLQALPPLPLAAVTTPQGLSVLPPLSQMPWPALQAP